MGCTALEDAGNTARDAFLAATELRERQMAMGIDHGQERSPQRFDSTGVGPVYRYNLTMHHSLLRMLAILILSLGHVSALAQTTPKAGTEPSQAKERWYIVEMFGQRAGWMSETLTTTDKETTSESASKMELARGALKVAIEMRSTFVETLDNKPVSMKAFQKLAANPMEHQYTFAADGITHVSSQSGQKSTRTVPLPEGTWLTPAAAKAFFAQRLKSGADEIVFRTMDAQTGATPINIKYTGFKPTTLKIGDRTLDVRRFEVENSAAPGIKSIEFVDEEGVMVRTETSMGGLNIVMQISTKEEALGEVQAPEIMVSTFIKPDRPIKNARSSTHAVYLVSVAEGDLSIPSTGHQSVEVVDDNHVRVTVSREAIHAAPADDIDNREFLDASAMIDSDDAEVKKLVQRAIARSTDDSPAARGEAIRRFVHSYINRKNLGVGFASASEVARKRSGDCSEHGVLTAALLRGAGIPSRVVAGVIYADAFAGSEDIFGYHMWAQGLMTVDGAPRWVDLDATLDESTPFDATHIALGVTALPEGELATSLSAMATTLGRLKIAVEEVTSERLEPAGTK